MHAPKYGRHTARREGFLNNQNRHIRDASKTGGTPGSASVMPGAIILIIIIATTMFNTTNTFQCPFFFFFLVRGARRHCRAVTGTVASQCRQRISLGATDGCWLAASVMPCHPGARSSPPRRHASSACSAHGPAGTTTGLRSDMADTN
jgi:hypothetical protein